jgi:hypothetical protein
MVVAEYLGVATVNIRNYIQRINDNSYAEKTWLMPTQEGVALQAGEMNQLLDACQHISRTLQLTWAETPTTVQRILLTQITDNLNECSNSQPQKPNIFNKKNKKYSKNTYKNRRYADENTPHNNDDPPPPKPALYIEFHPGAPPNGQHLIILVRESRIPKSITMTPAQWIDLANGKLEHGRALMIYHQQVIEENNRMAMPFDSSKHVHPLPPTGNYPIMAASSVNNVNNTNHVSPLPPHHIENNLLPDYSSSERWPIAAVASHISHCLIQLCEEHMSHTSIADDISWSNSLGSITPTELYQIVTQGYCDKVHFDFTQVYNQSSRFLYDVSKPTGCNQTGGNMLLSWLRAQQCRTIYNDTDSVAFLESFNTTTADNP